MHRRHLVAYALYFQSAIIYNVTEQIIIVIDDVPDRHDAWLYPIMNFYNMYITLICSDTIGHRLVHTECDSVATYLEIILDFIGILTSYSRL